MFPLLAGVGLAVLALGEGVLPPQADHQGVLRVGADLEPLPLSRGWKKTGIFFSRAGPSFGEFVGGAPWALLSILWPPPLEAASLSSMSTSSRGNLASASWTSPTCDSVRSARLSGLARSSYFTAAKGRSLRRRGFDKASSTIYSRLELTSSASVADPPSARLTPSSMKSSRWGRHSREGSLCHRP